MSLSSSSGSFDFQCDLSVSYSPTDPPIFSAGTGTPTMTVIALHGKSGSPTNGVMTTLTTDLNARGYDVTRPYLQWTSLEWNGTLCEGVSYINSLIAVEKASGNSVILLGHSLGGVFVFNYTALSDTAKPDGLVVLASGHYVPNSSGLNSKHAVSVQSAKDKVIAGFGDVLTTFQTSDYNISATPIDYLSFHDPSQKPDQFPDANTSISLITVPTLWLAGLSDPLLVFTKNLGIYNSVLANTVFTYKEIVGDHYSLADNVTVELDSWYHEL